MSWANKILGAYALEEAAQKCGFSTSDLPMSLSWEQFVERALWRARTMVSISIKAAVFKPERFEFIDQAWARGRQVSQENLNYEKEAGMLASIDEKNREITLYSRCCGMIFKGIFAFAEIPDETIVDLWYSGD